MGVQLFFVASAYTLCISNSNRNGESTPLYNYAIRRIFRIVPLYWFGILLYWTIASIGIYGPNIFSIENFTVQNIIFNFLFLHGFLESANNTIVPGGWSVATEMLFYTLFPFIINFAKQNITSKYKLLYFVFGGILLSQILINIFLYQGFELFNNSYLYFSLVNQLPCFLIGIGYYYYINNFQLKYNVLYDILLFIVSSVVSIHIFRLNVDYYYSLTPIFASISFLFLFEIFRKIPKSNVGILSEIGKVSFSMYIFHFIFAYGIMFIPSRYTEFGIYSLLAWYIVVVALSFIIAKLSYRLFEVPFTEMGKKFITRSN